MASGMSIRLCLMDNTNHGEHGSDCEQFPVLSSQQIDLQAGQVEELGKELKIILAHVNTGMRTEDAHDETRSQ